MDVDGPEANPDRFVFDDPTPPPIPSFDRSAKRGPRFDAKRPLNLHELELVRKVAPTMEWNLRFPDLNEKGHYTGGFASRSDSTFVSRTVFFAIATVAHISAIPRIGPQHLYFAPGKGWCVTWLRPKTGALADLPLPDDVQQWAPDYVRLPKPRSQPAYHHMLSRLSDRIEELTGERVHLNSLRCRHTGAILFKDRFNLTDYEGAAICRCSVRVFQTYGSITSGIIENKIRPKGYATLFPDGVAV